MQNILQTQKLLLNMTTMRIIVRQKSQKWIQVNKKRFYSQESEKSIKTIKKDYEMKKKLMKKLKIFKKKEKTIDILGEIYRDIKTKYSWPNNPPPPPIEFTKQGRVNKLSTSNLLTPWCEQQNYFELFGLVKPRTSVEMRVGSQIHKMIEDEENRRLPGFVVEYKPIEDISFEEKYALQLLQNIRKVEFLFKYGAASEVKLFSTFNGYYINGIADTISFSDSQNFIENIMGKKYIDLFSQTNFEDLNQTISSESSISTPTSTSDKPQATSPILPNISTSKVYVSDIKTIRKSLLRSQVDAAYFQTMIYRRMFDDLANGKVDVVDWFDNVFENLDFYKEFSPEFIASIEEAFDCNQYGFNLQEVCKSYEKTFYPFAGLTGDLVGIKYIRQLKRPVENGLIYSAIDDKLEQFLKDKIGYWSGKRPPRGVLPEDAFKCTSCKFFTICDKKPEEPIIKESLAKLS